jgi:hypothetical protein
MVMNKKGQEMSVSTLVLIVIGIVVLVMLILGFSFGWQNLWNKINILGAGSSVDTVVESCKIAATSDLVNSYCDEFKKVKIANQNMYVNCQYSAVVSKLDKNLACPSGDAVGSATAYCGNLLLGSIPTNLDDVYNGRSCADLLGLTRAARCEAIAIPAGDVILVGKESAGCALSERDVTKYLVTKPNSGKCCVGSAPPKLVPCNLRDYKVVDSASCMSDKVVQPKSGEQFDNVPAGQTCCRKS